ncbi:unnamed protein product [Didymodactylos carnosus]|uniref:Uncharacterized protein n=1 Tax=Didymodactylos carnosus TaxID=1234261 RepID=A0A8S2GMX6_9BILA|nr:unnamed protein product [Didymodactylos carnosus]CAF3528888.1 unnamed protein product [Didymodactylos carnosus]
MSRAKRAVKVKSYAEKDGDSDDDFVSLSNDTKKRRSIDNKKSDPSASTITISKRNESKTRARKERMTKAEQDELDRALKISLNDSTVSATMSVDNDCDSVKSTEIPAIITNEEISQNDTKTKNEMEVNDTESTNIINDDETSKGSTSDGDDENHKTKKTIEKQTINNEQNDKEMELENEEDEEIVQKSKSKTTKTTRKITAKQQIEVTVPSVVTETMSEIDLNAPRASRQKTNLSSLSITTTLTSTSKGPLGFPTSKIVVQSPGVHRFKTTMKNPVVSNNIDDDGFYSTQNVTKNKKDIVVHPQKEKKTRTRKTTVDENKKKSETDAKKKPISTTKVSTQIVKVNRTDQDLDIDDNTEIIENYPAMG